MKVFEVLRSDVTPVTEEQIINRLKGLDWRYEFSDDFRRIARGQREVEIVENMVYQLWKTKPDRAVQIWNENCPFVPEDKTVVPTFIFRLQAQEEDKNSSTS